MVGKPIPVLLVEDNPGDARLIELMLEEAGERRFRLTRAADLAGGREAVHHAAYGVVLLDLHLTDSHGLETLREMRRAAPSVAVVVLTGLSDEAVGVQAVQEGAQDYLLKGQVTAAQLAHALYYAFGRMQRELALAEAIAEEMATVRSIYRNLFPARPPVCAGFDIHGGSDAVTAAGGDFFDYLRLDEGRLGVVIGDVTGHGVGPAMLMAATHAYLRAYCRERTHLGEIVMLANRSLAEDVDGGRNVTLLLAAIDPARRTLTYTGAGHVPGSIIDASGVERAQLYSTGLPLGIVPDGIYPVVGPLPLQTGDVVVLLTDGVTEARAPSGEMFGRHRAIEVVRRNRHRSAAEIVTALAEEVRRFLHGQPLQDDATAVVLKSTAD